MQLIYYSTHLHPSALNHIGNFQSPPQLKIGTSVHGQTKGHADGTEDCGTVESHGPQTLNETSAADETEKIGL